MIKNILVKELPKHIGEKAIFIDVREEYEQPKFDLPNHLHIPMSEILERMEEIPKDGDVLIYCHSGGRSANVVAVLNIDYGYTNLYNVVGGALTMEHLLPELVK